MTNKEAIMILESVQPSCGEKYSYSESEIYEAIEMAISALAEQRWIPVAERSPEENGEYLVTRESSFYRYIDIVRKNNCNSHLPMASDIKAWMPLPEPWKGEAND